jgi:hypothetical protein
MNNKYMSKIDDVRADVYLMRLAIGIWIALAVAVCVKSFVQGAEHSVYPTYAWGSRHWWTDEPLHALYRSLKIDIYRYSPTFAIFFTPFALLPDWFGSSLWCILSVATTFCAMRMMVRELLPGLWPLGHEAWFLGLTAIGSMSGIWSGQSNSLLLSLYHRSGAIQTMVFRPDRPGPTALGRLPRRLDDLGKSLATSFTARISGAPSPVRHSRAVMVSVPTPPY